MKEMMKRKTTGTAEPQEKKSRYIFWEVIESPQQQDTLVPVKFYMHWKLYSLWQKLAWNANTVLLVQAQKPRGIPL